MANNVERGRTEITNTLLQDLKKARTDRPLSLLPQIWTDYKKDELANIYQKLALRREESSYELLILHQSLLKNSYWDKIKNRLHAD